MTRSSDLASVGTLVSDSDIVRILHLEDGHASGRKGVAIHNRSSHRRCVRGDHILPAGSHSSGHCVRCDHLVTDQVAIPWDQPVCPTSCWDAFTADDYCNPYAVDDWVDW